MRHALLVPAVFTFALAGAGAEQPAGQAERASLPRATRLQDVSWDVAEARFTAPDVVIVLPLGPAAQQHGPHLKLGNDAVLVEHLIRRILDVPNIVVAPPLPYHFDPAFDEYPGSVSLSLGTARDVVADVARSVARHGAKRVYVLNAKPGSVPALAESAKALAPEGVLLRYTDVRARLESTIRTVQFQSVGGHADEIETSMMLFVEPSSVEMTRAVREFGPPSSPFRLTRRQGTPGTLSQTGVWGDATLATREKGRRLVDALVSAIRVDIEDLRRAAPPQPGQVAGANGPSARGSARVERFGRPDECLAGDDRVIRAIGPAFYIAWRNQDANALASFWDPEGDMVHPDGLVEGSAQVIRQNRASLFMRPEYKDSRHSLEIGEIRCITGEVAIADAKWDLRGVTDARGQPIAPANGVCTLVLRKDARGWRIQAYRYSMHPHPTRPTLLTRPGIPNTGM